MKLMRGKNLAAMNASFCLKGTIQMKNISSLHRFGVHHDPLVLYESNSFLFDKERIWPQIPFAGTLIVTLHAYDKDYMLNGYGFDASDIS